jgi:hypothetical protein
MTDLTALLKDYFVDKRLAYNEPKTAAHEALIRGIVSEIEALKAARDDAAWTIPQVPEPSDYDALMDSPVKRKPGRPPKVEAA